MKQPEQFKQFEMDLPAPDKPKQDGVNREILTDVINEMLDERSEHGPVKEGFLWRAIFEYNNRAESAIKDENELKEFYGKAEPIILEILEQTGIKYRLKGLRTSQKRPPMEYRGSPAGGAKANVQLKSADNPDGEKYGWLAAWQDRQEGDSSQK
ncbi:MAG: hypothetical protein Q8O93_01200 [bacterium]|nr:hypothetical protein [bacterium]